MSKKDSSVGAIVAVAIFSVALLGLVIWRTIARESNKIDIAKYDVNSIIGPNDDNGHLGDNVEGDPNAPVLIFEYADYQCSGCATAFPRMKKLVEEYSGKLALVYRNFLLSYHQNGTAAASAAEAAAIQGYWSDYASLLFANQSVWASASGSSRTDMFSNMFRTASKGKGDEEKFVKDMNSEDVKAKINFDANLSKGLDITGTPSFFLDGEKLDFDGAGARSEEDFLNFMRGKIDAKLNK
ncbi:thioredoxin domain-containing protein [Candidatus Saccharibacteria bacterium]|nr:thioredoxin domain-containing protein [Candidatus Saccharibacteria bacterium]